MIIQNNKVKYVLAAAAATGLGAYLYYKYSMTNYSIDASKLSESDVILYN
jgi:hypothetical protein